MAFAMPVPDQLPDLGGVPPLRRLMPGEEDLSGDLVLVPRSFSLIRAGPFEFLNGLVEGCRWPRPAGPPRRRSHHGPGIQVAGSRHRPHAARLDGLPWPR